MNRKIMAIVLVATLALALSATAFAQTEEDFTVEVTRDGRGVRITGYKGSVTDVVIPATIQGFPVREVGFYPPNENITSIVIPEGVTKIGGFLESSNLRSVTLPSTLTEIASNAFFYCRNLKTITLPASLETIGEGAFDGSGLTEIALPASIKRIGDAAFARCSALTTVTVPASVQRIDFMRTTFRRVSDGAFMGCHNLSLASQAALRRVGYQGEF